MSNHQLSIYPEHIISSVTMAPVARLRALLAEKDKIIVCPGVYDGFTARIALNAGFDCLYMVRYFRTDQLQLLRFCSSSFYQTDMKEDRRRYDHVKAGHGGFGDCNIKRHEGKCWNDIES